MLLHYTKYLSARQAPFRPYNPLSPRAASLPFNRLPPWCLLPCLAILAGCAAGPDFTPPEAPKVSGYTAGPVATTVATPGVNGGEAQTFTAGADLSGDWWTLFHSQPLNSLIDQALAANPDLKAAQAALKVAHENTLAQRGAFLPSVTAGLAATRTRSTDPQDPASGASEYSLFTPQVSVAYAPDIFGLNRRTHESAAAQEQSARYQMAAAYVTLTANVANAAVQEASLRSQIDATHELIDLNAKITETMRYQVSKGYASPADLAAQRAQAAQIAATLPPLLTQLAQQRNLLAALTGRYPSETAEYTFDLSSLTLPQDLPLSLPSALVEHRPDVLQAQADMHAASAAVGIAAANRLPNLQLTGDAGSSSLTLRNAFGAGAGFWDLGTAITAPIYQGGALLHQERAAKAGYAQAGEQYRSVVLTAFENVADTLAALQHDAEALKASADAADAAKVSLDIATRQTNAGYGSALSLLNAEQTYQQARISLIQAQASRYADTVALYQALGGGWWQNAKFVGDMHGQ